MKESRILYIRAFIDHEFCYQLLKFMWFQTLKLAFAELKIYIIYYMAQITFHYLEKVVLANIFNVELKNRKFLNSVILDN